MDNHSIFVISDLHMGDGGARDNFALNNREEQLGLFLDYVASQQGNSSSWATCSTSGR